MTSPLKNDRCLKALLCEPVDRTPVWVMRQAGRYLPEYRATRAQAGDFMTLCRTPDLACEVTLQPLARFDLDAAILFSDILTVPDAMGLNLSFVQGEGPKFSNPIKTRADVDKLIQPDAEGELGYVMNAVRTIRKALDGRVPLIGFAGSPWTVATYAVEGQGTKDFSKVKGLLYSDPATMHALLDKITRTTIDYLNAQIRAGAQAVMVFDTWGGVLSRPIYQEFSLRYMHQIVEGLIKENDGRRVPCVLFTKNAGDKLADMTATGCDALGVDWTMDLSAARDITQNAVALQGNLDPSVLYASDERIEQEVADVLSSFGQVNKGSGHVFNLGHGIHQHVNPDKLNVMVETVKKHSPQYHV